MGIPSYFSYIIKNHPNILRTMSHHRNTRFNALYMDCNSIIYDAVRTLEETDAKSLVSVDAFENKLIEQVIAKIKYYIQLIHPTHVAYISFDGVAPLAKMDQQKERRHRSAYLASVLSHAHAHKSFNTTAITPGTNFMTKLSGRVNAQFRTTTIGAELGVKTVVVSASDEPGEGEHKMFDYLRNNSCSEDNVAVYGLDADLIMLSMFHCSYCFNIHIFREAPEFSTHILPAGLKSRTKTDLVFIDTFKFTRALLGEMGVTNMNQPPRAYTPQQLRMRIHDYVFMCFMLGNDFMPHFLALNIRTAGIGRLMDTYNTVIAAKGLSFVKINKNTNQRPPELCLQNCQIQWKSVYLFVAALAKNEHTFIKEEMEQRAKMAKGVAQSTAANPLKTPQDKEAAIMNIPMLFRQDEEYINPHMSNWQARYYSVAFNSNNEVDVHAVCKNYCEGLEWTFKYYTSGCPHWQWKYEYSYPPLLEDLAVYLSNLEDDHTYFNSEDAAVKPCSPAEQLLYVLPKAHHYLLPGGETETVDSVGHEEYNFSWIGCRYFWEAHLV